MAIMEGGASDLYELPEDCIALEREREREAEMAMEGGASDLYELPEDCIAKVLSLTSPCDVGRLSLVSSTFRSAGNYDAVWRRFLPPDYKSILARSADSSSYLRSLPLKELYFSLCSKPILIDDGMKSFSLDRCTGKKCYMLSARELVIVWGDTPEYWKWTSCSDPESRFSEVAVLLHVCWLEISGKINVQILSPATSYAAFLVFSWTGAAYGFDNQRADVAVRLVGSEPSVRTVYLDAETRNREQYQMIPRLFRRFNMLNPIRFVGTAPATPRQDDSGREYVRERSDGWWEIELGEFTTGEGIEGELEMRLLGADGMNWKGGLVVHGIEIRPKDQK